MAPLDVWNSLAVCGKMHYQNPVYTQLGPVAGQQLPLFSLFSSLQAFDIVLFILDFFFVVHCKIHLLNSLATTMSFAFLL